MKLLMHFFPEFFFPKYNQCRQNQKTYDNTYYRNNLQLCYPRQQQYQREYNPVSSCHNKINHIFSGGMPLNLCDDKHRKQHRHTDNGKYKIYGPPMPASRNIPQNAAQRYDNELPHNIFHQVIPLCKPNPSCQPHSPSRGCNGRAGLAQT